MEEALSQLVEFLKNASPHLMVSQWELDSAWEVGRDDAELGFPCHSPFLDEARAAEYRKGYESVAAVATEGNIWGRLARSQESEAKP